MHRINKINDIIQYSHATIFSLLKATLLRTAKRNHFITWPRLSAKNASKHLDETIATAKGHLDKHRKNFRITKDNERKIEDHALAREDKTHEVFIAYLAMDKNNIICTSLIG